ncbi:MAG: efflux RND transporter periplasmic adaptor subunit [Deltaproteobacteria bacterium]|nr:efflux RND transporter periplasmic adaptor subunit [Deltaproteobacteria bacterium]
MKRFFWLSLFLVIPFLSFGCGQEKAVTNQSQGEKPAAPKAEKSKDSDMDEMKGLTMETIQKEGKAVEIPPGAVQISQERQQLIGVKFGKVEQRSLDKVIRTVGRIDYDEKRLVTISPKIGGWIEDLYVDFTGKYVKRGERLLTIYSPDLVSAQEEYLIALRTAKALGSRDSLVESARRRLKLWDISDAQIKALEEKGQVGKTLTLHSPFSGFVLEKMAFQGMNVVPGMALYKLADLSVVWLYADIYEYELPLIRLGQEAAIELSYYPGEVFRGKVIYIYPYLDPATRTAKVRFQFSNPRGRLKPEMYANVQIKIPLGPKLVVPEEAVIDTGERQVAMLDRGAGYFEPREVKLGTKVDQYYVVLQGLKDGDRVVTSANFLIDSESKFKEAVGGMAGMHDHGGTGKEGKK